MFQLSKGETMKNKKCLLTSIIQMLVGLVAIVYFVVLIINGEVDFRWTITLILAIGFVLTGTIGLIDNKKKK